MSGHCDFCGIWHSGSCCHPGRIKFNLTVEKMRETLKEIKLRAEQGRDWNKGHFCDSRSQCQSIVDLCKNAMNELVP